MDTQTRRDGRLTWFLRRALRVHLRCGAGLALIIQSNLIEDIFALKAAVS